MYFLFFSIICEKAKKENSKKKKCTFFTDWKEVIVQVLSSKIDFLGYLW